MKKALVPLAAALALLAAPALADRPPTLEERELIQTALIAEGFVSWKEIEWDDDGYWEVDDALTAEGVEYDLKLSAEFQIIERERD
ncbi:PepSY domain-containing protein [Pararhodobacter sp.]|uniref:PepSY domain-containing protein n=1 Tax=Pararhodobacter sp. TaxID=2127056 RepID=UPI002FDE6DD6